MGKKKKTSKPGRVPTTHYRVPVEELRLHVDPGEFPKNTSTLTEGYLGFGHPEAMSELERGLQESGPRAHICCEGEQYTHKYKIVREKTRLHAIKQKAQLSDKAVMFDFTDPQRPIKVLNICTPLGKEFRSDMAGFMREVKNQDWLPPYMVALVKLEELKKKYEDLEATSVVEHLEQLRETIGKWGAQSGDLERRLPYFSVNLQVDNSETKGIPFVDTSGEVSHESLYSSLVSFTGEHDAPLHQLIKLGKLAHADGGVVFSPNLEEVLSDDILAQLFLEGNRKGKVVARLELAQGEFEIEVPLDTNVKWVCPGNEKADAYLEAFTEFAEPFGFVPQFRKRTKNSQANRQALAIYIASVCDEHSLPHFGRKAVVEIVREAASYAESKNLLTTDLDHIERLVMRSGRMAKKARSSVTRRSHVVAAKEELYKNYIIWKDRELDSICSGRFMMDVSGDKVGHISGLEAGSHNGIDYGSVDSIIVTLQRTKDESTFTDIEEESDYAGSMFKKAFRNVQSFISNKFGIKKTVPIDVRFAYAQSYRHVDGPSGGAAIAIAALSTLASDPSIKNGYEFAIRQGIFVTGDIQPDGNIGAIGGAESKIRAAYEVIKARRKANPHERNGLAGVVIPHANREDICNLPDDIMKDVNADRFRIYSVRHVDELIEITMGVKADKVYTAVRKLVEKNGE